MAERQAGTWLVRGGVACFVAGLVFAVAVFLPFLFGERDAPAVFGLGAMLAPIGFAAAIAGLYRQARATQRAILRDTDRSWE